MSSTLRTWLREPLVHFLAAGAAIFLLYRLVGGGEEGPREIVVSEAQIESLAEGFAVPASRVEDPEALGAALRELFALPGPALLDVAIDPTV